MAGVVALVSIFHGYSQARRLRLSDTGGIGEFAPTEFVPMSTEINIFNSAFKPPISERFQAYNDVHSALKRLSTTLFRFQRSPEYEPVLFDARAIQLFARFNVAICSGDTLPQVAPAHYDAFAKAMNSHDDSGFGWAYIEDGVIVWDETANLTPADPESFCVLDHEITEGRILGADEVAVSTTYFENAERLVLLDQCRETKYYQLRQNKKNERHGLTLADIHTKEAKDKFAMKRKALLDAASTSKKQKVAEGGAGGDGDATMN
ncbi:hypothetical protein MVEN_00028900 [Mycena venus]|uniref:Uncharacterized protein n=1 Tax=Mycena venus TaxID=2733690 RepID=A0A8H7DDR2_9AGAR|nr:hypothetical protein MVEN_00028900 [Mycena venus]